MDPLQRIIQLMKTHHLQMVNHIPRSLYLNRKESVAQLIFWWFMNLYFKELKVISHETLGEGFSRNKHLEHIDN